MRKIMVLTAILLGGAGIYLGRTHLNFVEQKNIKKEKDNEEKQLIHKVWNNLETADDEEIKKLPADFREKARLMKGLKEAVSNFEEAEDFLARAGELARANSGEKINPLMKNYYDRSMDSYRKSKEIIDRLEEIEGDSDYNHCLYYTKGEIYYRILQFVAKNEEKMEIFNQIVVSFKKALLVKPRDIDTEINVEILRMNRGQMLSGTSVSTGQMLKQLPPSTSSGRGGRKGKY